MIAATPNNKNARYAIAEKLIKRKRGVSIKELMEKNNIDEKQARNDLDHLRRKGLKVKNVARGTKRFILGEK